MGILVELCRLDGGIDNVLESEVSIFGQDVVKTPQNEAFCKSGNRCLQRRSAASPTYLISIINAMLLIRIDLFLKIRQIVLIRWRKKGRFPPRSPRFFVDGRISNPDCSETGEGPSLHALAQTATHAMPMPCAPSSSAVPSATEFESRHKIHTPTRS